VNAKRLGRLARMLRVRQRLTQVALATRAGVSRRAVSTLELGRAHQLPLAAIEAIARALGGRIDLRLLWNGPELDRLLDEGHAALGVAVKQRLERWGWLVQVEVSYSQWGERGRIDLLAFHPAARIVLVIELKTLLVDVQALLGTLDAKARLAPDIARRFGWEPRCVVPVVAFSEDRTTRNRVQRVEGLFERYSLRGRSAGTWMRLPDPASAPTGLLLFVGAGRRQRSSSPAPRVRSRRTAT
jgi:transcriptional regulator with XRE-family HTH domain